MPCLYSICQFAPIARDSMAQGNPSVEQLELLLAYLHSSEPRIALNNCMCPRVACLPLAQQQAVILCLNCTLQTGTRDIAQTINQPHSDNSQLLRLLNTENGKVNWGNSMQQLAHLALQQITTIPLLKDGQLHAQTQQQPLPTWLLGHSNHCFGWLHTASSPHRQQGLPPSCTAEHLQAVAGITDAAAPNSSSLVPASNEDEPPIKRVRATIEQAESAQAVDIDKDSQKILNINTLIDQLKELDASCAPGCVDAGVLQQALSAQGLQSTNLLQLQLQQLSTNAVQALVSSLLQQSSGVAGLDGSDPQLKPSSAETVSHCVMSEEGWERLLAAAVLPRLQQLQSAAPQALLACLTSLALKQPETLVSVVLQPLVVSTGLIPVQAQLLVKLSKEVPQLQPKLLNLLLHAASAGPAGHAASNSTGLGYPGGISSCCWTEAHATLLKSLVDTCSQVVSMQLDQVIVALKVAAQQPALTKSTAFGQMLMALVKQYAAVLTAQQISGLQAAASATNTFLTRSLVNKLQQLAQQQKSDRTDLAIS